MKPQVIGGACSRVQQALDEALAEGVLSMPPELAAHAGRCPRCGPEVKDVERLFSRLRKAVAGADLGQVPRVVDHVMARTVAEPHPPAPRRRPDLKWVLGQVAAVAAILVIAVGTITYGLLKANEAVSGARPAQVVYRLAAPFRELAQALFHSAR
jgi:hypothetical protein